MTNLKLRPYQQEARDKLVELRSAGTKRALIHLATGLGKTALAATDALGYQKDHPGKRVLFVSHMNDIGTQTAETFKRVEPAVKLQHYKSGETATAPVVLATFQALQLHLEDFKPGDFDYIIYDEAHHIEATTFKKVREYFQPDFELALTATPTRADGLDILDYFGQPVFVKGLAEGIAEGWLSAVDYHIVLDEAVKEAVKKGFNAKTLDEVRQLFSIRVRNEIIASNVLEHRKKLGMGTAKTIVFCQNRQAAENMAKLLGGRAYHSSLVKAVRQEVMSDFRSGNLQVICTVDMFNEGIDIPDAKLVVFLRSTSSSNIFEQQLGRGLRRSPGKDSVTVLDFVANVERIDFVNVLGHHISEARAQVQGTDRGRAARNEGFQVEAGEGLYIDSDFVFEDSTIELLEKYNKIRQPIPEGYLSIPDTAALFGVNPTAIRSFVDHRGMQLTEYGSGYRALSPEQVELVREFYAGVLPYNSGLKSVWEITRDYHLSYDTLHKLLDDFGITIKQGRITPAGRIALVLETDQFEKFKTELHKRVPEGSIHLSSLTYELGLTSMSSLKRRLDGWGIKSIAWLNRNWYTPQQLADIRQRVEATKRTPITTKQVLAAYKKYNGHVMTVAEKLGVTNTVIYEHLRESGISLADLRSQKAKEKVASRKSAPELPEGYTYTVKLAKDLHVTENSIRRFVDRQGWEDKYYKHPRPSHPPTIGYTPEQTQIITEHYQVYTGTGELSDTVRDDVISLKQLEAKVNSHGKRLRMVSKELGITPKRYLFAYSQQNGTSSVRKKFSTGVTLEEAKKIENYFTVPEGYISLADASRKLRIHNPGTIHRMISRLGIKPTKINVEHYLSPMQIGLVKSYLTSPKYLSRVKTEAIKNGR